MDKNEKSRPEDAGSGGGLFSLAAFRLGATVTSFDVDPDSVACTQELKRRYGAAGEIEWRMDRGRHSPLTRQTLKKR